MKKVVLIENHVTGAFGLRAKLLEGLSSAGYEVVILAGADESNNESSTPYKVLDVGISTTNPFSVFGYAYKLYKFLKDEAPDVCLTWSIRPNIYANFVTRWLNIPTITTISGIGPLLESNRFAYILARRLYKMALKQTRKVFFQNADDLGLFLQNGFVKQPQIELVPGSGVDTQKFAPRIEKKQGSDFVFLFIGRLLRDKGLYEYVEAAEIIKKNFPNVQFWVLGDFWANKFKSLYIDKNQIDNWVQQNLIIYKGKTNDVRDFIAQADCVVLPSYREGTANVLLEASSMATPIITTNVAGCKETVTHGVTGFVCEPKNSVDLASQLKKFIGLSEAERVAMGAKARVKMIQEFEKKIVVNRYLSIVREILKLS